mmetsp:Transcript_2240/g.8267  ORF Transcript_2240/g.8267 Transcript_2240/m.8267 type:complete len:120 (-) Transcript_2240:959-1318(-)
MNLGRRTLVIVCLTENAQGLHLLLPANQHTRSTTTSHSLAADLQYLPHGVHEYSTQPIVTICSHYPSYTSIFFSMALRHTGHSDCPSRQLPQHTKCPQGTQITFRSFSMHTTQNTCSSS